MEHLNSLDRHNPGVTSEWGDAFSLPEGQLAPPTIMRIFAIKKHCTCIDCDHALPFHIESK
ncbi:hypothetical protein PSENEW3_00004854 [Picochlorum sp. SENEW3]|nr:hypothetical protein PSENEW3_00004854 [Picochlorum sp. SENEW3]